jgi:hypothetical protein
MNCFGGPARLRFRGWGAKSRKGHFGFGINFSDYGGYETLTNWSLIAALADFGLIGRSLGVSGAS